MNKKFEIFFKDLGMEITGNGAYGVYENYEFNAITQVFNNQTPLTIHLSFYANDEIKRSIVNELRDLKLKYFKYSTDTFGLSLGLNDLTVGRLVKRLPDVLKQVLNILNKYEVLTAEYCPVCGKKLDEATSKKYNIEGIFITLDEKCVEDLNAVIQAENKEFKDAPNNYLLGFIGAVVGAIVGVISFIILYFIGYISALSSLISIALGTFLYKKLGGKQDKIMIIIVTLVSIISMLLTVFIIYFLVANVLAPNYGYTSTGFNAFKDMMKVKEFANEFTINFVMTLVFTLLGVVGQVFYLTRSIRRQPEIK